MKKFLFITLFSIMSVFMLSGCAEEEETPTTQSIDPKTLVGTYEIEFFYTDAKIVTLTNDCSKLAEYVGGDAKCSDIEDQQDSDMTGEGTIEVSDDKVRIISKVQMNGGGFNNPVAKNLAKNDKYNYTVYNPIPVSSVQANTLNADNKTKGTTGRNAGSVAGSEKDTYKITVENDIVIIDMVKDTGKGTIAGIDVSKAPVLVRMKKVSDTVKKLDPNTRFPTPDISDVFKEDVGYTHK